MSHSIQEDNIQRCQNKIIVYILEDVKKSKYYLLILFVSFTRAAIIFNTIYFQCKYYNI